MDKGKNIAVVLAAGRGKRMNSKIEKQFLEIGNKPVLYYSLKQFQDSSCIDEIILVSAAANISFCRTSIVEKYNFTKVKKIIEGGKERYDSVYQGVLHAENCRYIFIHDGARPFINEEIIRGTYEAVCRYEACVTAVPVKETVKISDQENFIQVTPPRDQLWIVQTPQVFSYPLIKKAFENMLKQEQVTGITDDAMVVEKFTDKKVKLVHGSYQNIKITTQEDLAIVDSILGVTS